MTNKEFVNTNNKEKGFNNKGLENNNKESKKKEYIDRDSSSKE